MTRQLAIQTPALQEDEAVFMTDTLWGGMSGRNLRLINARTLRRSLVPSLAARGLVTVKPYRPMFGGFTTEMVQASVSVAGARALVAAGAVSVAALAVDVDVLEARLVGYRKLIEQGVIERDLNLDGWEAVTLEPFGRVAAAILIKRGLVEEREAETDQERALPGVMWLRATDKAVGL